MKKKIVVWRTGVNFLRLIGIQAKARRARGASLRSSPRARLALPTHLAFASVRLKDARLQY